MRYYAINLATYAFYLIAFLVLRKLQGFEMAVFWGLSYLMTKDACKDVKR